MITLIIGTNNSGKSELAEKLAVQRGTGRKYYLATMQLCDDASRARAEKHRRMRAGKGFLTIDTNESVFWNTFKIVKKHPYGFTR